MNIKKSFIFLLVTLSLFLGIAKISFAYPFAPAVNYSTGIGSSYGITTGDFNGDGILDLAVTNVSSSSVSILLGSSSTIGTFDSAVNYSAGLDPWAIITADFNGDSILDLAVANANTNNISVLLGSSTAIGTFNSLANYSVNTGPIAIAAGDFNGDSILDLATANYYGSDVSVLLGSSTATGTFNTAVNYSVGPQATAITIGDFNNDGILDLAVANQGASNNVSVLIGSSTATGTFDSAVTYSVGPSPYGITSGDFNGDSILDLATANLGGGNVSVLIGSSTATGTFNAAVNYIASSTPVGITSGDFNGDSILDLAVTNQNSDNVSILLGSSTATGTFNTAVNYSVGSGPWAITKGDFNADGLLDLAVTNQNINNISILLGIITPSTQTPTGGRKILTPKVSIFAASTSISYNGATTISWMSDFTNTCTITKNNIPWQYLTNGNQIFSGNLTSDTTFTATCAGAVGDKVTSSVIVKVGPPIIIIHIPPITTPEATTTIVTLVAVSVPAISPYQFSFTQILKLGSVGDEVKQLQIFLNTHGFPLDISGAGSLGNETTYFGLKTKQALIKFQEAHAQDILAPQNLTKGTGIFWIYSKKIANQILLEK